MNVAKAPTNKLALLKGKAISTSTPSFSIRYNAEEEEVEQLYDVPKIGEAHSDNSSPQLTPLTEKKNKESLLLSKSSKRSGSLEEGGSGEPWRLFTEIRGRITKTVEEKIEEINRKKKKKDKLKTHLSLSDSEEKSEPSQLDSSSPEKSASEIVTTTEKLEETADSDLGDVSDTEISLSSDRATTPVATEVTNLIVGVETNDPSISYLTEKRRLSAVFRNRQKGKVHRRKVPKTDKIELAVDALAEVEKSDTTESLEIPDLSVLSKSQFMFHRKKAASIFIGLLIIVTIATKYIYDVPPMMIGFIIGAFACLLVVLWTDYLFDWICETRPEFLYLHGCYQYTNTPFLSENMINFKKEDPEDCVYTGWMNEFPNEYRPDIYHVSQTKTVHIKLAGSILKLGTPKNKIPKRAVWNERDHKLLIDIERTYDISNCSVKLLPEGLVQKRIWSKKYPICINLLPQSHRGTKFRDKEPIEDIGTKSSSQCAIGKETPIKEIIIGEGVRKKRKWVHNLLRKLRKDEKICEHSVHVEDADSDIFLSDLDIGFTDENDFLVVQNEENDISAPPTLSKSSVVTQEEFEEDDDDEEEDDPSKDYIHVPHSLVNKNSLYLFTRTDREKDLWFRRLVVATGFKSYPEETTDECLKEVEEKLREDKVKRANLNKDYLEYMKQMGHMTVLFEEPHILGSFEGASDQNFLWLNLFLARMLYDPMKNPFWVGMLQTKIQRKLSVIKVPTFMEKFVLSNIEFTKTVPTLEKCKKPKLNEDGLWVELDVSYQGVCKMTIDTKINLMKMKMLANRNPNFVATQLSTEKITKSAYLDSSQEDSAETSEEDEDPKKNKPSKALMVIDKIAASKVFQQVTDNKLVKKAMENVSNTTISLYVEVRSLVGTVVLNIPPPPSDRLWYGFKQNTKLHLSAKPRVGDRGINMGYITGIIEKKLYNEFQKILFIPNMDDLLIPIMTREKPF